MRVMMKMFIFTAVILCHSVSAQIQQWPMVNCEKGRTSWASLETVLYPPLQVAAVLPVRSEYAYIDALTLYNDLLCISLDEDPNTLEALDLQTGDTLWTCTYGGSDIDFPTVIRQTSDLGYIIFGKTWSFGAGSGDIYLVKTAWEVGIDGETVINAARQNYTATIFKGPLQLPEGKKCRVFDISGRIIEPTKVAPGIYFIEIEGNVVEKVIKIR